MATYRTSLRSPRPPAEVFDYLARFSNAAEWDPGVVSAHDPGAGPPQRGSAYHLVVRFFGLQVPLDYRVAEIDTSRRVVFQAENRMVRSTDVIEVAPAPGGGSTVNYSATLTPKGPAVMVAPIVAIAFRRTGDRASAGLTAKLAA